jgi:uncharacterized sporulation protein YeaH/YhbH (DUF444 family)
MQYQYAQTHGNIPTAIPVSYIYPPVVKQQETRDTTTSGTSTSQQRQQQHQQRGQGQGGGHGQGQGQGDGEGELGVLANVIDMVS